MLLDRRLDAVGVAIDPVPTKGIPCLPWSTFRASAAVLANPVNIGRTVALAFTQFRYGFANSMGEREARDAYESLPAVPIRSLHKWVGRRSPRTHFPG